MSIYEYFDQENNHKSIKVNLAGKCFENLLNGTWELGFINDNPGLENDQNDTFYHTEENKLSEKETHKCFNNKVTVKLCDGSIKTGHIIHWFSKNNIFCITNSQFWDQFD